MFQGIPGAFQKRVVPTVSGVFMGVPWRFMWFQRRGRDVPVDFRGSQRHSKSFQGVSLPFQGCPMGFKRHSRGVTRGFRGVSIG